MNAALPVIKISRPSSTRDGIFSISRYFNSLRYALGFGVHPPRILNVPSCPQAKTPKTTANTNIITSLRKLLTDDKIPLTIRF